MEVFSSISPARSGWIAPGRIGFMSTQRRENRPNPATESFRGGLRSISNPMADPGRREIRNASRPSGRPESDGYTQIPVAQFKHVHVNGTAVPPVDLAILHDEKSKSFGPPTARSLQSDCSNTAQRSNTARRGTAIVGLVPKGTCHGWSPSRASRQEANLHDSLQHSPQTGLPIRSSLPVLRVPIRLCRGYRQH
jgi:hypothetical protein